MNTKFKVGDVCITRACACHPSVAGPAIPFGAEITILSIETNCQQGLIYETDIPFGKRGFAHYWARECYLELKHPPIQHEPVGDWAECPWWPTEVIA